jgi:hypothetical protein
MLGPTINIRLLVGFWLCRLIHSAGWYSFMVLNFVVSSLLFWISLFFYFSTMVGLLCDLAFSILHYPPAKYSCCHSCLHSSFAVCFVAIFTWYVPLVLHLPNCHLFDTYFFVLWLQPYCHTCVVQVHVSLVLWCIRMKFCVCLCVCVCVCVCVCINAWMWACAIYINNH